MFANWTALLKYRFNYILLSPPTDLGGGVPQLYKLFPKTIQPYHYLHFDRHHLNFTTIQVQKPQIVLTVTNSTEKMLKTIRDERGVKYHLALNLKM